MTDAHLCNYSTFSVTLNAKKKTKKRKKQLSGLINVMVS